MKNTFWFTNFDFNILIGNIKTWIDKYGDTYYPLSCIKVVKFSNYEETTISTVNNKILMV